MTDPLEASNWVRIEDQSLRDGLQNEARLFSLEEKLEIVGLLASAGIRHIQIGSLVDPRRVPQMADTEHLAVRAQAEWPELDCSALVLNAQGLERAMGCGLRHLSMSVSVVDQHSQRNAGCDAPAALRAMAGLVEQAASSGMIVRAGVQCAFGLRNEYDVTTATVVAAARCLVAAGASVINLADTAGLATPARIKQLVARIGEAVPDIPICLHLHDTRGLGLANLMAGYASGVRRFDAAAGGLGGCPFIAGAAGNVATEDAVDRLAGMGGATGIDLPALARVVCRFEQLLGRQLPGQWCRVSRPADGPAMKGQKNDRFESAPAHSPQQAGLSGAVGAR